MTRCGLNGYVQYLHVTTRDAKATGMMTDAEGSKEEEDEEEADETFEGNEEEEDEGMPNEDSTDSGLRADEAEDARRTAPNWSDS